MCQGMRENSLDLLSTCLHVMELHFDGMLFSNLGNKNSDVGHIKCLYRLQVTHPCFKVFSPTILISLVDQKLTCDSYTKWQSTQNYNGMHFV